MYVVELCICVHFRARPSLSPRRQTPVAQLRVSSAPAVRQQLLAYFLPAEGPLNRTPDWVRARVLAISTLVFQGAVAVGSAAWGAVAVRLGIGSALRYAGAGTLAMTALALFLRLPDSTVDLSSWIIGNYLLWRTARCRQTEILAQC